MNSRRDLSSRPRSITIVNYLDEGGGLIEAVKEAPMSTPHATVLTAEAVCAVLRAAGLAFDPANLRVERRDDRYERLAAARD